jgi:thymidylate synthase (FAD)
MSDRPSAKVEIISCTKNPINVISRAAGICYGKSDRSEKRVERCFNSGHLSVFEHAVATFLLTDISRACSHQIVRHRLASYSQQSQRYCRLDVDGDDWFVIPPDIWEDDYRYEAYRTMMHDYAKDYQNALVWNKPEDARFLLPEATKTKLVMTMNLREIYHFLDVRYSPRAQWEICDGAGKMKLALYEESDEWRKLIDLWIDSTNRKES